MRRSLLLEKGRMRVKTQFFMCKHVHGVPPPALSHSHSCPPIQALPTVRPHYDDEQELPWRRSRAAAASW